MAMLCVVGCAAAPAPQLEHALSEGQLGRALGHYETAGQGRPEDLARIADAVLERELGSAESATRGRALAAVARTGNAARPLLERLRTASDLELRSAVLAQLVRLGDDAARSSLRPLLDSGQASVLSAAVEALEAATAADAARLRQLLDSPFAQVRLAALGKLRHAAPVASLRLALVELSHGDPEPRVAAAALSALANHGPAGFAAIEAALERDSQPLRLAAIAALVRADPQRAAELLVRYLQGDPSVEGLEVARHLQAGQGAALAPAALAQVERALAAPDASLRARAATVLPSFHLPALDSPLAQAIAARLKVESAPSIELSLVLALPPSHALARRRLAKLSAGDGVVAVQAAAELARRGDRSGRRRLVELARDDKPLLRSVALATLARDLGLPHQARRGLLDKDSAVRIAVAAAILSGVRGTRREGS